MMYRVSIVLKYREAYFDFKNGRDAVDFMTTAAEHATYTREQGLPEFKLEIINNIDGEIIDVKQEEK